MPNLFRALFLIPHSHPSPVDCLDGRSTGEIVYYQATTRKPGGVGVFNYDLISTGKSPMTGIDVDLDAAPTCVDFDGDGRLDCAIGNQHGQIWYVRNTGTSGRPAMYPSVTATSSNPLKLSNIANVNSRLGNRLCCIDMDGDGEP